MPLTAKQLSALRHDIHQARIDLQPYREQYVKFVSYYLGSEYCNTACDDAISVPLMRMAVNILSALLAPGDPQVLCDTQKRRLRPMSKDIEATVNFNLREVKIGDGVRECVEDAMFMMGTMKTGVTNAGFMDIDGAVRSAPKNYARSISFDDLGFRLDGKSLLHLPYIAERTCVLLDVAREMPQFDKKIREQLLPSEERNDWYDTDGGERIGDLGRERDDKREPDFAPYVDLVEVYIPYGESGRPEVITLAAGQDSLPPLSQIEYEGPAEGPYHFLGFGRAPGSIIPFSPISANFTLYTLIQALYEKLGRQALGQKKVYGVTGNGGDAEKITSGADRSVHGIQQGADVKEFNFEGPDQVNLAFAIHATDRVSKDFGNLELLGGIAPQSGTVGQDRMLSAQSSRIVEDMAARVRRFEEGVSRSIAWHRFYDPFNVTEVTKKMAGTRVELEAYFSPDARDGDFLDYNFKLDPYSSQWKSPSERLNALVGMIQTFGPLLQADPRAGRFNVQEIFRFYVKQAGIPELSDVIMFADGTNLEDANGGDSQRKSPMTTRTYQRVNSSEKTNSGQDQVLMQNLLGSKNRQMAGAA